MGVLEDAKAVLSHEVTKQLNEQGCLNESDNNVNDASRDVIASMYEEHGSCWLGRINLYRDDPDQRVLVKYDPNETVLNFACSFVIPVYNKKLVELIEARHNTPYTTASNDYKLITAIMEHIETLDGVSIFWT